MNIDPVRTSSIAHNAEARSESRIPLRVPTTPAASSVFRQGPKAVARTLARATSQLTHASGFVRTGRGVATDIRRTLDELRQLAEQASLEGYDSFRKEKQLSQFQQLQSQLAIQLESTFGGKSLFSGDPLRVQVDSSDLGASQLLEIATSPVARRTLFSLAGSAASQPIEIRSLLETIDASLTAGETLEQELTTAGKVLDGMTAVLVQERLTAIDAQREEPEPMEIEQLTEQVRENLHAEQTRVVKLHLRPDPQTLLALLSSPGS